VIAVASKRLMTPMLRVALFAGLSVFSGGPAQAETPDPPVPLFDDSRLGDEPLALRISTPWRRLQREDEEEGPFEATLEMDGLDTPLTLSVEKRGVSRQQVCSMPPIRLRFDEEEVDDTLFAGNRAIKVVTHCRRGREWEQYVLLELLAYRLYSALTELSFRVRPATIVYHDSERDRSDGPHIAFLIEDDRLVGNRHGLDKVDIEEIRPSALPAVETSVFMLFQYMIGNVDFSPLGSVGEECCHNAKLIGEEDTLDPLFAVHYDFDSSGWVDASYAVPPANLPIRDVRQRLFRGFCRHNEGLPGARQLFLDRRDALYRILESETRLSANHRRNASRYLDAFFDTLEDEERFSRLIIGECRS
jgi:hypothetical protein